MSLGGFTISDGLLITATFLGPIAAVQTQKWIERAHEKENRRRNIFHTLMATRAVRAGSLEHVQALNLIDLIFHGNSKGEKAVRNAWALYLDFLNQPVPPEEAAAVAHNERGVDFLVELLATIGAALGYDFNSVQLKRGGYYPRGQADEKAAQSILRDNLVKIVTGEKAFPMEVTKFPASDDALRGQLAVQAALLEVLSGKLPLKIKEERA